jgi:hypothetical protein
MVGLGAAPRHACGSGQFQTGRGIVAVTAGFDVEHNRRDAEMSPSLTG